MIKNLIIGSGILALAACEQQLSTAAKPIVEPAVISVPVVAQASSGASSGRSGEAIFDLHCAGCHDPGTAHAATKQLALVRGNDKAIIRQRADLSPDYIKLVVRDGLLEMPPFRPTEINAEELDSVAMYIVASARTYQTGGGKND
jgi:mono/diheme cytochrome c family protein